MQTVSLIVFALAAAGGIALAVRRIAAKPLPMNLALGHGAAAILGIVLLFIAVAETDSGFLSVLSLIVFVAAGIGGSYLFSFHLRKKELPAGPVAIHALGAIAGIVILVYSIAR